MPEPAPPLFGPNLLDEGRQGVLGAPADRIDGPLKVSGEAVYAYEYAGQGKTAYGFIVGAAIPKGRITAIDAEAARAQPGVLLVVTHENAPEQSGERQPGANRFTNPKPFLIDDRVRYRGQPIAFVVAETFEQARYAASFVRARYEEDPSVSDMAAAHATLYKPAALVAGRPTDTAKGDFHTAFAAAPVKIDVTYRTPVQHHNSIEPQSTMAVWDGDRLTVYSSTQSAVNCRNAVANTLKLPIEKVRFICKFVGGGFGAKLGIEADAVFASIAARQLSRPVKVAFTRQQTFVNSGHRPNTEQRIRLACGPDGRLIALGHECLTETSTFDEFIEPAAAFSRNLYAAPNRLTAHRAVRLDMPTPDSMRAPGEASGMLAFEAAMDELAYALDMDPVALRLVNEPDVEPESGRPFSSRNLVACLQDGARRFGWNARPKTPGSRREGRQLIGYGMSAAIRSNLIAPSKARVRLGADGGVRVQTAATDIGTGAYTILAQVAAETLGVPMTSVTVELGDTDLPPGAGSGGSIAAGANGSAVFDACCNLRGKLAQAAGANDPAQMVLQDSLVTLGGRTEPLPDFLARHAPEGLEADGEMIPSKEGQAFAQAAYGATFTEVAVDIDSGEIRIRRMLGVFAAGRILNAKTARSQIVGGMIWGIGNALMEETVVDERYAAFVNNDLAGYHVAAHADVPDIEAVFLDELDDKANPLKSKGVGELGICGAGAAVNNAIFNATGIRVRDYPVTLDKLLAGLPDS